MPQRPFRRIVLLFALAALWTAAPAFASEGGDGWVGKAAPDFQLKDLDGNDVSLAGMLGKKVVWLNFWGLRCGPCIKELPALQKLYQTYGPKGLVIVGVNADGVDAGFLSKQMAEREDLKAAGITFPVVPDPEFAVIDQYGLEGAPLNVMIDRKGVIQFRHDGYEEGDEAKYAKVVETLLAQ